MEGDRLLALQDLADYLGVPKATLYAWNTRGGGPPRYRVGKHVRYRLSEVDQWLKSQKVADA